MEGELGGALKENQGWANRFDTEKYEADVRWIDDKVDPWL